MARAGVPLDVYFDFLRKRLNVTMVDAFRILLSDQLVISKGREMIPLDLAMKGDDLAPLTRLRKRQPGDIGQDYFRSFNDSIPSLFDLIVSSVEGKRPRCLSSAEIYQSVYDAIMNVAAPLMMRSLDDHGLSADIFDNALDAIQVMPTRGMHDRCVMALMLITVTACLGSAAEGGQAVEAWYWTNYKTELFSGTDTTVEPKHDIFDDGKRHISLQRLNQDGTVGHRHTIEPEGTVIGSLPDIEGDFIADVDLSVTYEHLRVFEKDGHWYAEGLGSLLGTELQDGINGTVEVVEPPFAKRRKGETYPPVEIHYGDILLLGTTRFVVQPYSRGE